MCSAGHAWVQMWVQVRVDGRACRWVCMRQTCMGWACTQMDMCGNTVGAGCGTWVLGPGCGHSAEQDRCHMSGWVCTRRTCWMGMCVDGRHADGRAWQHCGAGCGMWVLGPGIGMVLICWTGSVLDMGGCWTYHCCPHPILLITSSLLLCHRRW